MLSRLERTQMGSRLGRPCMDASWLSPAPHGAAQSLRAPPRRGRPFRPLSSVVRFLEIPQQPLDIFELELRAEVLAEAPAQFFQNAPRALHVNLARHLDGGVVTVVAPAQGSAERIGLLLGAPQPEPAGLAVRSGTQHALLPHRLVCV